MSQEQAMADEIDDLKEENKALREQNSLLHSANQSLKRQLRRESEPTEAGEMAGE